MTTKINPYCKQYPGAFIEFTGLVTPCCWLVTDKNRYNDLKEFLGDKFDNAFITHSQEDIVSAYQIVEQSWSTDNPFKTCSKVCAANDPDSALNRATKDKIINMLPEIFNSQA